MAQKPQPSLDADSENFWGACARHELVIQRCAECTRLRFPPVGLCPHCGSAEVEHVEASGRGRIYSWIVVTHPVPKEIYAGEVPYAVALVELEEGVRLPTNIVGCEPSEITADMPVEVVFKDSDGMTLPLFRPSQS
ncbi:MAG: hypothetical protein CMM08_10080 [Rhodospirillaceae bacterium]|jgi:hypothetical protein|nr:hypothetical protein [Rhodospirillaceae bacterium]|tara:strand:+ start:1012 stop:1419 length:408 start_codon:yes stop_codon:yes gene_type:complete